MNPLIGTPGVPEMLLILAVVVLLFGAKKLPELARGSGRALRIFKAETKGLVDDDDQPAALEARPETPSTSAMESDADRIAREQRDGA
jgi:sec-independent protein translocase protein TatA